MNKMGLLGSKSKRDAQRMPRLRKRMKPKRSRLALILSWMSHKDNIVAVLIILSIFSTISAYLLHRKTFNNNYIAAENDAIKKMYTGVDDDLVLKVLAAKNKPLADIYDQREEKQRQDFLKPETDSLLIQPEMRELRAKHFFGVRKQNVVDNERISNKWLEISSGDSLKIHKPIPRGHDVDDNKIKTNKWHASKLRPAKKLPHKGFFPGDFDRKRHPVDFLGGKDFDCSLLRRPDIPIQNEVQHLGVLLDAGRHYFPVDWIKRMIHVISVMNFNYLHFRLTDDQSFNVRLDSYPLLAYPTTLNNNTKVYSPEELRAIVKYAKSKGVDVVPEINVPGHAASWGGIPGLIVECPEFICAKGYGVPLNVSNPLLRPVLQGVLKEIIDIFDDPPFLHLGGDEVNMARPCFEEVRQPMFDYNEFESMLLTILSEIQYNESKVIRWEMSAIEKNLKRTGGVTHFWLRHPGSPEWDRFYPNFEQPIFLSTSLYFDTNEEDCAYQVYMKTKRAKHNMHPQSPLLGIVGGTFELNEAFWGERNVIGRLLAVSLGASNMDTIDPKDFFRSYRETCGSIGFPDDTCNLYGVPPREYGSFRERLKDGRNSIWKKWIKNTCSRYTEEREGLACKNTKIDHNFDRNVKSYFWRTYMEKPEWEVLDVNAKNEHAQPSLQGDRLVNYTGLIMNLAQYPLQSNNDTNIIKKTIAPLGLNMVQLRLITDEANAYSMPWGKPVHGNPVYGRNAIYMNHDSLKLLKDEAAKCGVAIMPEIASSTNAGGWRKSSFNAHCPNFICEHGKNLPVDINDENYPPVLYSVVRELLNATSTPFIHLGHDEREISTPCLMEASENRTKPDFDNFERTIRGLLDFGGVPSSAVIRWENSAKKHYPSRFGDITQCVAGESCRLFSTDNDNLKNPWLGTVDVRGGGPYQIYSTTRDLASKSPLGIVAKVGSLREEELEKTIEFKLLAFSIGTLDLPVMTKHEFEKFYVNKCFITLKRGDDECRAYATSNDDATELVQRMDQEHKVDVKRALCRELTEKRMLKYMKDPNERKTIYSFGGQTPS